MKQIEDRTMQRLVDHASLLLQRMRSTSLKAVSERVERAYAVAREAYSDEKHWSGVSLLDHVCDVLEVLLPFEPDEDAIIATLLHHVLQTQKVTLSELEERFGPAVRSIVGGCHLLSHVTVQERRHSMDDLRLILLSVSDDVRTVLIALCERCALLRRLPTLPHPLAKQISHDVLWLFAPVAARLGIYTLKHELEGYAFPVLYPNDAEHIEDQCAQMAIEKGDFLGSAAAFVRQYLHEQGIETVVQARQKHPYSIFSKMRLKSISTVSDVYDLFALRVLVNSAAECYQVLGMLHRLGRPLANRFKDYIAFPKPNGYQSLHTTLAQMPHVPEGTFVEIQIRTHAMHREAQYGVAAHWSYKEKGSRTAQAFAQAQLSRLLANQQTVDGAMGEGALADHIFVLTPRGDIVELPEGATPIDFAFQVHTNLGLSFRSARVNGSIVPLDYELQNGDVVEIQRRKVPEPSAHWLQLLKTASSRSKLKHYLYALERPQLIERGRSVLNAELQRHGLPSLDTDCTVMRLSKGHMLSPKEREDILVKIAQGSERPASLLHRLDVLRGKIRPQGKQSRTSSNALLPLSIGMEGNVPMPKRFAKCCKPEVGAHAEIAGVVNRQGTVTVHRTKCRMLKNASPGRRIRVWWE